MSTIQPEEPVNARVIVDQVNEAIHNLPEEMLTDYNEGMRLAPEVFRDEMNPVKFYIRENGNTWAAAVRIARNMSCRRMLFGEDYWYRPLRLQGGALRPDDVALIRQGPYVLRTQSDNQQVLVMDHSKISGSVSAAMRQRVAYYITGTGVNETTRKNGLDVIIVINGFGLKISPENGRLFQISKAASSFGLRRVVLVRDPTDSRNTLKHLFEKWMLRLTQRFLGGDRIFTVAAESPADTMNQLAALGYKPAAIPVHLGGEWTYEVVGQYVLDRVRLENSQPAQVAPMAQPLDISAHAAAAAATSSSTPAFGAAYAMTTGQLPAYSVAPAPPPLVVDPPLGGNEMFLETDLIRRARDELNVDVLPPEVQATRERNALYSRRSYHRRKQQKAALDAEIKEWEQKNGALRAEQEKLTILLQRARYLVSTLR